MQENIQAKMKELFGNSCYCYCLAYINNTDRSIKHLTKCVLDYWFRSFVDDDGFVSKPLEIMNNYKAFPMYKDIEKPTISNINDIPEVPTITEMKSPNGGSHFVVCHRNGNKVVLDFDPSGESNAWKGQKFISYRKFIKK